LIINKFSDKFKELFEGSKGIMMINMTFDWTTSCQWIFASWESTTTGGFVLGCILTFLFCFLCSGFSEFKLWYLNKYEARIHHGLMFFVGYSVKMLVMLLMMSMNVWVNLMIVIGTAAGYLTMENIKRHRKIKKFQMDG
jgi:hypothetical protein